MKGKREKMIGAGMIMALILLLAACGASRTSSTAAGSGPSGKITWHESTDNEAFAGAVVKAFNAANTDVQCELVLIPQDDFEVKIKTMLTGGGSDVNVFHIGGVALTNSYGANGALLDVSKYYKDTTLDVSKFGGKTAYATLDNGQLVAMPEGWGGWFMYYNKTIFDEAGIPYPAQITWDEYAALASRLTSSSGSVKKWGGYYPAWTLNLYALQMDSYLTAGDIGPTKQALEFMNRIYNVDKSHMDLAEMRAVSSDPLAMFLSGNVGMMVNGAWALAQLKSAEEAGTANIQWGMTNLPTPPGVKPKTGVGGISFVGINANTSNPDACWKFVEFLVGPQGAEIYAKTGNLPAYVTGDIGQYYVDYYKYEATGLLFDPDLKINAEQGKDPRYAEVLDVFRQNAELYLLGEISIDKFGDDFLSDRSAVLR